MPHAGRGLAEAQGVVAGDVELHADLLVDVLSQALGGLDAQAVQVQVVAVAVITEKPGCLLGRGCAHGHHVEGGVIDFPRRYGPEEVGDAEPGAFFLAGEAQAGELDRAPLVRPDDEVVPIGVGGEVTVSHGRAQHAGLAHRRQLLAQDGSYPGFEAGVGLALQWPVAPLVPEKRSLVDVLGNFVQREALLGPGADEGGDRDRVGEGDRRGARRAHRRHRVRHHRRYRCSSGHAGPPALSPAEIGVVWAVAGELHQTVDGV